MRRYTVAIDGRTYTIDVAETTADTFEVTVEGRTYAATLTGDRDLPGVAISPEIVVPETRWGAPAPPVTGVSPAPTRPTSRAAGTSPAAPRSPAGATRPGSGALVAPMPGVILEIDVVPGAAVRRGDPVLVLEAMKMRNAIRAPRDGVVGEVTVEVGEHVDAGQPLARIADPEG